MNEVQKQELIKLKNSGRSYKEMASTLCISEGTIKSFFRRQKIKCEEIYTVCKNCGVKLEKGAKSNVKKFCSDVCRYRWWRKNTEDNRECVKINVCKNCGTKFKSYDNKVRKYCSHACYIEDRFKNKARGECSDKRAV